MAMRTVITCLLLLSFGVAVAEFHSPARRLSVSYDSASAIDVITADEFNIANQGSIKDLLNTLPSFTPRGDSGGTGTAPLNLRGIGSDRTLVLINGRRYTPRTQLIDGIAAGSDFGVVDLNTIPTALIERVEVLKDGTSAMYGSDAIAGVVNFIVKDDFEGVEFGYDAQPLNGFDDSAGAINPIRPALGIYDGLVRGFSGSVEYNQQCDFGAARIAPGAFLLPWIDGFDFYQDGFNFYVPFEQPAAGNGAQDAADAAGNGVDTQTTPATGSTSTANNTGDGSTAPGTPAKPPCETPATPPEKTDLQEWDRGVPPFYIVLRSPEVAHLVDELKPYYDLRDELRGQMTDHGYFGDNDKEKYAAAREVWKGTRREILTLLGPYMDPAVAGTAQTGDPSWEDGPGPVLPTDIFNGYDFGGSDDVVHPSQRTTAQQADSSTQDATDETPGTNKTQDGSGEGCDDLKLDFGIRSAYGWDGSRNGLTLRGQYDHFFNDDDNVEFDLQRFLADKRYIESGGVSIDPPSDPSLLEDGFDNPTYGIDVEMFLAEKRYLEGGGVRLDPAEGAILAPGFQYELKFTLPNKFGYKDSQFNSDLGSQRAFAEPSGRLQYGNPYRNLDKFLEEYLGSDSNPYYERYDIEGSARMFPVKGNFSDYDARADARYNLGANYFDRDSNQFDFDQLRSDYSWGQAARSSAIRYDPTKVRIGFNLREGWGAITIPIERYEAETYKVEGGKGLSLDPYGNQPVIRDWAPYFSHSWQIGENFYYNFRWPEGQKPKSSLTDLFPANTRRENDFCGTEAFPVVAAAASMIEGKRVADDWIMDSINSNAEFTAGEPVIVAVIDTGLDYHHFDLNWDNLWMNPDEIPDNDIDDDNNGFVDDIIGWDFTAQTNTPWDHDGHGTFVSGLIAADTQNGRGITGINPHARIMVLKALNNFGHTRVSWLAQAILYATDNGARVINLSVEAPALPEFVQDAIDYADSKGVLVIAAAGNLGEDITGVGPAGLDKVLTVAATDLNDEHAAFSNWGAGIDIAAPGVHIKSLRARQTDFRLTSIDAPYERGSAILGGDRRYYRADGTSFAAPLVTGAASLIWSRNPDLTHTQVRRMLEQSARDIDTPGRDQFTGYGLLDLKAALAIDPEFFTLAEITGVTIEIVDGKQVARVAGSADADQFARARLEIGSGDNPGKWKRIGKPLKKPVADGVIGDIPVGELRGATRWTIRVVTEHKDKSTREARYVLNIG